MTYNRSTLKLLSTEYRYENGEVFYPMGNGVIGRLMYDKSGFMSVQHMSNSRKPFASGDWLKGTPEEIKAAFESYRAYYGKWTVDEQKNTVTHHIEAGSLPNWNGTDFVRQYQFIDNRLILKSTPLLMAGKYATAFLIWERLG